MYRFTIDADALAALRRRPSSVKSRFRFTTEDGLHLDLPDPRDVAPLLTIDADLRRKGSAILDGTTALPLAELTPALAAAFEALPERPDAGEPYSDIYHAARSASPTYRANYMLSVVRAFRDTLRAPDTVSRERGPAKPRRQVVSAARDRIRQDETETARYWFAAAKEKGVHIFLPGEWVGAKRLYTIVRQSIDARDMPPGITFTWSVPRERVVAEVAAEFGLTRRRTKHGAEWGTPASA